MPAGCEVVEGPDGALVALPRGAHQADPAEGQALPPVDESAYPPDAVLLDQMVADTFVPTDEAGPFADAPVVAPPDEPATTKRRRGGSAA